MMSDWARLVGIVIEEAMVGEPPLKKKMTGSGKKMTYKYPRVVSVFMTRLIAYC